MSLRKCMKVLTAALSVAQLLYVDERWCIGDKNMALTR